MNMRRQKTELFAHPYRLTWKLQMNWRTFYYFETINVEWKLFSVQVACVRRCIQYTQSGPSRTLSFVFVDIIAAARFCPCSVRIGRHTYNASTIESATCTQLNRSHLGTCAYAASPCECDAWMRRSFGQAIVKTLKYIYDS